MSYVPTIAECRLAAVEKCQLTRQSAQHDNAENAMNINEITKYELRADLTTALTGGSMRGKAVTYVSFIRPLAANITANIGDKCRVFLVDSSISATAPYDYEEWSYTRYGWQRTVTAGGADLTNYVATAASEMSRIWGACSATSGTFRGLSLRTSLTGTGTQDGESLRAYTLVTGVITGSGVHGAHITAQVGDETTGTTTSSCSGEMAGVRATIGTGPSMTIAAGTYSALRLDTYLQTTLASLNCQFINMSDVGTYGVTEIIRLGTITGRTTSKTTMTAPYAYISGKLVLAAGASVAFKVVTQDGSFYIPGFLASDLT